MVETWRAPGCNDGLRFVPNCIEEDWLGAPMYFSHYGVTTNKRLIREAGLRILSARIEQTDEDGAQVSFLWVVATKPGGERSAG